MNINKFQIILASKFQNSKMFLYKNELENYCLFLGGEIGTLIIINDIKEPTEVETQAFYYTSYMKMSYYNLGETIDLYGENIEFKSRFKHEDELFKHLFNAIDTHLSNSSNLSLIKCVDQISSFLSTDYRNIEKIVSGYIAEVLFVYKLLISEEYDIENVSKIYHSFQKKRLKKNDYNLTDELKVEVKSTLAENRICKIKEEQYSLISDISLFYVFIKYDVIQRDVGMSFYDIFTFIQTKLGLNKSVEDFITKYISLEKMQDICIDSNNIEMYVIDYKKMPIFWDVKLKSGNSIRNIEFDLDIFQYQKTNNINFKSELNKLIKEVENATIKN